MWENIEEDALLYVHEKANDPAECKNYVVGDSKWDESHRVCTVIVMSKTCFDIQYMLKVDSLEKKLISYTKIGEG